MTDSTTRAWTEYYRNTTLAYELKISQLQRDLDEARQTIDALNKALFCGAQLRLELLNENAALRMARRESTRDEREALYRLIRGQR